MKESQHKIISVPKGSKIANERRNKNFLFAALHKTLYPDEEINFYTICAPRSEVEWRLQDALLEVQKMTSDQQRLEYEILKGELK